MGDGDTIVPGCYYPGCNEDHEPGRKFCPKHDTKKEKTDMAAKKSTKKSAKKSTKKSAKKSTKKSAKKSTKKSAKKSTKKSAKKKAASKNQRPSIDWASEIAAIQKLPASKFPIAIDMGTPGSAQVTRVRLLQKDYTKGLTITTQHTSLIFERN